MAKIPQFTSLDEAAEFWDRHDFEDYVDDTEPVSITVRLPPRENTFTVSLETKLYKQIQQLAIQRGAPPEKMISRWIREKALDESGKR